MDKEMEEKTKRFYSSPFLSDAESQSSPDWQNIPSSDYAKYCISMQKIMNRGYFQECVPHPTVPSTFQAHSEIGN